MTWAVTGAVVLALVVATAIVTYEVLRAAMGLVAGSRHRYSRLLWALGAVAVANLIAIAFYTAAYCILGAFADFGTIRDATPGDAEPLTFWTVLYFSAATYSTLGFGDFVPMGSLRLIAAAEGLNGLLLIAWTVSQSFLAMGELRGTPGPRTSR